MSDDFFAQTAPLSTPQRKSSGLRGVVATGLAAFLLGAGLIGWAAWSGKLSIERKPVAPARIAAPGAQQAGPAPVSAAPTTPATTAPTAFSSGLDQRLAALEQRMTRLDLQAGAAAGNASRAEGLLIAFAARRAIERGAPLGYLEDQLRLRFAAAQPTAVDHVLAAARQPVTLDQLLAQLDALAPRLEQAAPNEGGWARLRRELGGLFTVYRDSSASAPPEQRLERVKLLLRSGQVEAAVAELQRLPGRAAGAGLIEAARRYDRAMRGLELIEAAALQEPHELKGGAGERIEQASPVTGP